MPSRCIVPGCKGNYDNGPRVSVFSFPSDEEMKQKWISAIPRSNLKLSKASKVCELHFHECDIEKETSVYDETSGKKITVALQRYRLKKTAVPKLFPGCPYLTSNQRRREDPDVRKFCLENEQLQLSFQQSLQIKEINDQKNRFSDYEG